MKIGLLSDTHSYFDEDIYKYFADCDQIWHAGDIGNIETADKLEAFKPLRAVYGNIDGHELRARYPKELHFECGGITIWMTHIGGYPGNYPKYIHGRLKWYRPTLFICGHSHILKVMRDQEIGTLHMNPGACGIHGFHKFKTLLRFSIINKQIKNLEVIELGLRGEIKGEMEQDFDSERDSFE